MPFHLASDGLLATVGVPWPADTIVPISTFFFVQCSSVHRSRPAHISPCYKQYFWVRAHPNDLVNLIICKDPISK